MQVSVDTQCVQKTRSGIEFRRRANSGVNPFISLTVSAVELALVRHCPKWFAGRQVEALDVIIAIAPAHGVKPIGDDNR